MARQIPEIVIRGAEIPSGQWRNFEGKATKFNTAGKRSFTVFLDPNEVEKIASDGWNVKIREAREEGDEDQYFLKVAVSYEVRPPTIVLITHRGRRTLQEDEIEFLDFMEFDKVDMIIRPYAWNVNGESGVKAYLKAAYFTMHEDELALEYADVPEIGANGELLAIDGRDYIEGEVVSEIEEGEEQLAIEAPRRR